MDNFKLFKKTYSQPFTIILFILVGLVTSIKLDLTELLILILITITFLQQDQTLLRKWLQLLLNLLPLFISLLILDILLDLGYFSTILLILKISYFILLSIFAVSLIPIQKISRENIHEFRGLSGKLKIFLISTLRYIYQISDLLSRSSTRPKDIIEILTDSIKSRKGFNLYNDPKSLVDHSEGENEVILDFNPFTVFFLTIFLVLIFWIKL